MNYELIYLNLFRKASKRTEAIEGEKHHFIPTSYIKNIRHKRKVLYLENLLKTKYENALVLLTYREHYIAHLLLFKMFDDQQTMYALNIVINRFSFSRKYESFRRKLRETNSILMAGKTTVYDTTTGETKMVTVEEFNSNDTLIGISKALGINKIPHNCKLCNKVIHGKANFVNHERYYCEFATELPVRKTKQCSYCDKVIALKSIARHEMTCNSNPDKIKLSYNNTLKSCKFCGKTGNTNVISRHENYECKLNINIKTAKKSHSVKCKYCGKNYSARGITLHERSCKNKNDRIYSS